MSETEIIGQLAKICDIDGKELKPKESAKLFHKLGLISKTEALKQEDKIKLIQSAALFNAAIFRNPENVEEIKHDLKLFCSQFLTLANAGNPKDLIEVSQLIANDIAHMRNKVILDLAEIKKIPEDISQSRFEELKMKKVESVINLQNFITQTYAKIMKRVAGFCEEIMGNPPCRYALVGLGSLSRKEITPYSDFENIIVLDDAISSFSKEEEERIKEHFRWYAVIFQIILINLGETILPAVYIPSLNNGDPNKFNLYDAITTLGISFDGMMPHACKSPLGRQMKTKDKQFTLELIQTASKMASFIGSDENLKNGYHLADMLMISCFVAGNQEIYDKFQDCVEKEINGLEKGRFLSSVRSQISENRNDFKVLTQLEKLNENYKLNIKRMIYRSSTIFVSAIGKIHDIKDSCCFDILEKLIQQNSLTEEIGKDLKFAIAVACEIRLRVYMDRKSQNDVVLQSDIKKKIIDDAIGIKTLLEYFAIVTPFQESIFDLKKIAKPHKYIIPQTCYYIHEYTYSTYWASKNLKEKDYKGCMSRDDKYNYIMSNYWVGTCKYELKLFEAALRDMETSLEIHQQLSEDATKKKWICIYKYWIGRCKYELERYDDSLVDLLSSLNMHKQITEDPRSDTWLASCYFWLGLCYYKQENYTKSKENLNKCLAIHEVIAKDPTRYNWIAISKYWIGMCEYDNGRYSEAVGFLQASLAIQQRITEDPNKMGWVANSHYWIGSCFYKTNRFKDALPKFKDALAIREKSASDPTTNDWIACCYYWIGMCKSGCSEYKEALPDFQKSLKIRQKREKELNTDEKSWADLCHNGIEKCLLNANTENFKAVLDINKA